MCQSAILLFVANYRQPLATHTTPVRAAENTMFFFRQRIFLDVEIGTCLDDLVMLQHEQESWYFNSTVCRHFRNRNFRIDKELGGRKKQ